MKKMNNFLEKPRRGEIKRKRNLKKIKNTKKSRRDEM
jgi:hypothetical protein